MTNKEFQEELDRRIEMWQKLDQKKNYSWDWDDYEHTAKMIFSKKCFEYISDKEQEIWGDAYDMYR